MRKIYEYHENMLWCSVYDYTMDTVKEKWKVLVGNCLVRITDFNIL